MVTLSVITICFNNLSELQTTCASVDTQLIKPTEHLIINGSTKPEIANWLATHPQPNYRKWINEPDKGISDAFNKGIAHAQSAITHLLNSGDQYASDEVLADVLAFFEMHPNLQWLSGKIKLKRGGEWVIVGKPFDKKKLYRGMRSVSHPTWFLKKEVYDRVGVFNSAYQIAMDYDLMCRLSNEPYLFLDKTIALFDDTGISSANYLRSLKENRQVYESYFGFSWALVIWQLRLTVLHHLLKSPIGKGLFKLKQGLRLENW